MSEIPPIKLVSGRHREQSVIGDFVLNNVKKGQCASLYISGCPGTGKSLSVHIMLEKLRAKEKLMKRCRPTIIELSAMRLQSPHHLYPTLLSMVTRREADQKRSALDAAAALQEILVPPTPKQGAKAQTMIIVVIDEIDHLLSSAQMILYRLFEWAHKHNSRLMLIGVANAMDLTDRFLPRLRERGCNPEVLAFTTYSTDDLRNILAQRVRQGMSNVEVKRKRKKAAPAAGPAPTGPDPSKYVGIFHAKALEFCARKIGARNGDARKCLDVARACVDDLETRLCEDSNTKFEVTLSDMARAVRACTTSPLCNVVRALPQQPKFILCVASLLTTYLKDNMTLDRFWKMYTALATKLTLPPVSHAEFSDSVGELANSGLASLSQAGGSRGSGRGHHLNGGKQRRTTRLVILVSLDDVEFGVTTPHPVTKAQPNPLFASLLKRGRAMVESTDLDFV